MENILASKVSKIHFQFLETRISFHFPVNETIYWAGMTEIKYFSNIFSIKVTNFPE